MAKSQRLSLDLETNKDLAALVADLEPGDKVDAVLSIVAKDDKTLTVELEEVTDHEGGDEEDPGDENMMDEEMDMGNESPAMKVARGA